MKEEEHLEGHHMADSDSEVATISSRPRGLFVLAEEWASVALCVWMETSL